MGAHVTFLTTSFGRFAFRFLPKVVRAMIPTEMIGAYLLITNGTPVYIGRSDHCVQSRLSKHPLLGCASHFVWEPCRSSLCAFYLEAFWFHQLQNSFDLLNTIHPARPLGFDHPCPFCNTKDIDALRFALY